LRSKLLIENFIFFGFLRVLSSLLPFAILPIIVRYLPNPQDFATYDNYTIIVSIFCSLSALGTYDAMFREFYKNEDIYYRKSVIKTGLILVLIACFVLSIIAILLKNTLAELFFDRSDYTYLIYFVVISIFIQSTNRSFIGPSKMVNNKKHIFFHSIVYSLLFYILSLVMLELGYGFISLIYSQIFSYLICIIIFGLINLDYFIKGDFNLKIASVLLKIGLPLVPIFIIYWANNALVRIFIVNYLGTENMGIFSLGSRYAAVSSLLQVAFAGGWSFFNFSTMKDIDHVSVKTKIFKYIIILIAGFYYTIGLLYEPFFNYAFPENYSFASTVFPSLFLAPLLLILYQIVANQFTIIGKSQYSLFALIIGLFINIVLGYCGSAVLSDLKMTSASIPIGYFVSVILVTISGIKFKIINIDKITIINFLGIMLLFYLHYIGSQYLILYTTLVLLTIITLNKNIIVESINIIIRILRSYFYKNKIS
jgi:O-antigen/teichoic acid export membrane protein